MSDSKPSTSADFRRSDHIPISSQTPALFRATSTDITHPEADLPATNVQPCSPPPSDTGRLQRTPKRLNIEPDNDPSTSGPLPKTPKTPTTPGVSQEEALSFVFGDALPNFDMVSKPSKSDVVRNWMYEYDHARMEIGKWKMPKNDKIAVIKKVVSNLVDVWKDNKDLTSPRALDSLYVKVQNLVTQAEKLKVQKKFLIGKNKLEKLKELQRSFDDEFLPYSPKTKESKQGHDYYEDMEPEMVRLI